MNADQMKTQVAIQNRMKSVKNVDEMAYLKKTESQKYLGVKDLEGLKPLVKALEHEFILHTIDHKADHGRAIDVTLINPLTGRLMTGSSSGTAINVFLGINDLGIGSDGGGSVLAPAMALNLYGYIDPTLPHALMTKRSTDQIDFTPSCGLITRDADTLKHALVALNIKSSNQKYRIAIPDMKTKNAFGDAINPIIKRSLPQNIEITEIAFPDIYGPRQALIDWLKVTLKTYDLIITLEGPIDYLEYGDSIQGLFSTQTKRRQAKSGKGLLRVVNMANAVGLVIPAKEISSGLLVIGQSNQKVLTLLDQIPGVLSPLVKRYFYEYYLYEDITYQLK